MCWDEHLVTVLFLEASSQWAESSRWAESSQRAEGIHLMPCVSLVRPPDWVVGQTHPLFREPLGSSVKAIPTVNGEGWQPGLALCHLS